jgi:hypothetical protein
MFLHFHKVLRYLFDSHTILNLEAQNKEKNEERKNKKKKKVA